MTRAEFRQHVSEQAKLARATGEAWLSWGAERLRLVPVPGGGCGCHRRGCAVCPFLEGGDMIVKFRGKVYAGVFSRRKGDGPLAGEGFMVQPRAVLALVAARFPRERA